MSGLIEQYLEDPFLRRMYDEIRAAGPLRSTQIDITHACNLRCTGCYFFAEELDRFRSPKDEALFDEFVEREKARGTNYMTVVGGEPSLMLGRLKKLYDHFWLVVVTNGTRPIPVEGFEDMAIACSVWGDHETDIRLRGGGKRDVFAEGLKNFRDDSRVAWYYTTTPGNAHEIESVVGQCVDNGNYVGFNFYGDISHRGGSLDHRHGFGAVCREIDRMIARYPERILLSSYVARVVASGELYGDRWGHESCCTLTVDHPRNAERLKNGRPYNPNFRAYNPDLTTLRRCCAGDERDCNNCFECWAHFSWIILNLERHLGSKQEFTNWLTTMYLFYLSNHIINFDAGVELLPEIHRRTLPRAEGPAALPAGMDELLAEVL